MYTEEKKFVVSDGDISYYVVYDKDNAGVGYGIYAELDSDETDSVCVRKIYFTEEEAALRCKWLCENRVYPIGVLDVLRNII